MENHDKYLKSRLDKMPVLNRGEFLKVAAVSLLAAGFTAGTVRLDQPASVQAAGKAQAFPLIDPYTILKASSSPVLAIAGSDPAGNIFVAREDPALLALLNPSRQKAAPVGVHLFVDQRFRVTKGEKIRAFDSIGSLSAVVHYDQQVPKVYLDYINRQGTLMRLVDSDLVDLGFPDGAVSSIYDIKFLPDGSHLFITSYNAQTLAINTRTGAIEYADCIVAINAIFQVPGSNQFVNSLDWPDFRIITKDPVTEILTYSIQEISTQYATRGETLLEDANGHPVFFYREWITENSHAHLVWLDNTDVILPENVTAVCFDPTDPGRIYEIIKTPADEFKLAESTLSDIETQTILEVDGLSSIPEIHRFVSNGTELVITYFVGENNESEVYSLNLVELSNGDGLWRKARVYGAELPNFKSFIPSIHNNP